MIEKKEIRRMSGATTYNRGMDFYLSGKILEFDVTEHGEEKDDVVATVKGSGRKKYEVMLSVDRKKDKITRAFCGCPAYFSYSGICKHCVAVALEYLDDQAEKNLWSELAQEEEDEKGWEGSSEEPPYAYEATMPEQRRKRISDYMREEEVFRSGESPKDTGLRTTPSIRRLLDTQVSRRISMIQSDICGQVRLEPYLECNAREIHLEFRIGITHKYVMKDVFGFAHRMEQKEEYSYGQKLKFVHTLEAFAPQSVPLVHFLLNWVRQNRARFVQTSYYGRYGYGSTLAQLRRVPLGTADLEDFIDAVEEQEFAANVNDTGERMWHLTGEKLPRTMQITGKPGGIEVEVNALFGYVGNRFYLYFADCSVYRIPKEELEPIQDFLSCMADIPERKIAISKKDVPLFCRELLPLLEEHFTCEKTDFDETAYGILPASFEIYLDAPQKQLVTCKVLAVYGDKKYSVYGRQQADGSRDLIREAEVGQIVSSYCNAYDEKEQTMALADDEEKLYELLVYGIPRLQQLGEVFVSDAIRSIHVTSAPKVSVGLSVNGDWLELNMTSAEMPYEDLIEVLSRYNKKKKFYRLKNGDFVNMEGEGIQALLELQKGLNLTASQLKKETVKLPRYRALYLDSELRSSPSVPVNRSRTFRALIRNMKTVEDNDFEVPHELEPVLREYQKRGFLWMKTLKQNGFGGILADDMGLGKTLQVIAFLLSEFQESKPEENRRCLIVCPASLVFNWNAEFERFAPQLPVRMVTGTAEERRAILAEAGERGILLTSYDLLKRDVKRYAKMQFFCQVIDEAQYIKNHNTQAAKAVKEINSGFRLALSGTPMENRLSELWSIFDYLMPGFLYGYQRFRDEIEVPVLQRQDEAAMTRLQKMIRPFVLRRLKKDVLTDLPDKLEEYVYARMEGGQQKLYDAHVQRLRMVLDKNTEEEFNKSKIQTLSELTKLRQICCDPALLFEDYSENSAKTEVCLDLIRNAAGGGHKILLFSQFTSMLDNLCRLLEKEGISYYLLTGATSREKRKNLVDAFQKDGTQVFCISLKAGGTGLNLTAADIVIHYDPWWNLAVQNQATDRAYRIGQENVVSVYKLIMKGTIEENITKLQEKKHELADQVLEGAGMEGGSFTKEELLELLR